MTLPSPQLSTAVAEEDSFIAHKPGPEKSYPLNERDWHLSVYWKQNLLKPLQYDGAVMVPGVSGYVLNWVYMVAERHQSLRQLHALIKLYFQLFSNLM